MELSFPVLADTTGEFFEEWDPLGALPMAYIIDQEGVIVWVEIGGSDALEEIEEQILMLIHD